VRVRLSCAASPPFALLTRALRRWRPAARRVCLLSVPKRKRNVVSLKMSGFKVDFLEKHFFSATFHQTVFRRKVKFRIRGEKKQQNEKSRKIIFGDGDVTVY